MTKPLAEKFEEIVESIVIRLTRIAHPQDLGKPTSDLEVAIRDAFHAAETEIRADERARIRNVAEEILEDTIRENTFLSFLAKENTQ
jgi:hypothetical protein